MLCRKWGIECKLWVLREREYDMSFEACSGLEG